MTTAFRNVPRTGVIYVMSEAAKLGYSEGDPEWRNLGQGMPETGPLPGGPPRAAAVAVPPGDLEYAPVAGLGELRQAVADLYNARHRRGRPSRYSAENVAIAGGGRAALTRVAAALGNVNLGHFLPDYTAYEELLDVFRLFTSIPILREPERGYAFGPEELRREILGRGLGALLASNPSNPTGRVISGPELAGWVDTARELDCALILDEFYSHYAWSGPPPVGEGGGTSAPRSNGPRTSVDTPGASSGSGEPPTVSAAGLVEDVDQDPVIILDGLSKNWRYPGWRVSWIVGPRTVIEAVTSAGSFLDGGASRPLQRAAVELLTEERARGEAAAIQAGFRPKRELMLSRLKAMGVIVDPEPQGTFYCWGSVEKLPPPWNTGMGFFRKGLEAKVITVPGEFFDVNPGKRRAERASRFRSHVRFSFGPGMETVKAGLDRLEKLLRKG